ncbi:MAG TPA: amidohydrolase family protein [Vicinamibacterales bacterium]
MSLLLGVAALVTAASGLAAIAREPGVYAIQHARIVPASGPPVDRGTVVIARGVIQAVGADVTVPPEAWIIDGQGLTVYPGLVDAWTDLGLQRGDQSGQASGRPGSTQPPPAPAPSAPRAPAARGPEDRPASTPWRHAADELTLDDRRLAQWREAGFTAALSVPRGGILPGQGTVIVLAGERPGDLVLRPNAALQVTFQPPGNFASFPGSLMGVIAYLRQVFLDAEHDAIALKAYEAGGPRVDRPEYDRTVRTLQQARAAGMPVLLPAQTAPQIQRVLNLAAELNLPAVVVGAHGATGLVDRLAEAKAPVIVSLKWPERNENADPEAQESLRSLRLRDRAPGVPAALQKRGVRFAFSSDGVAAKDLIKHVRKAIDAGLSPDAALRALTIDAADILGVAGRIGSIERGKIANLVVTDGDLFAEGTKVKMTFVDGVKYDVVERPSEDQKDQKGNPPTGSPSASGTAGSGRE